MDFSYFTYLSIFLMLFATTKVRSLEGSELITAQARRSDILGSCDDAIRDGVYQIEIPASGLGPFYVYCLFDEPSNRPWTLVQRRMDGSQNFYRNWQDYKNGIGNLFTEFWIGLDILHALTNSEPHELWIQLENKVGERRSANYSQFAIGNEDTKYTLSILGKYSGNAGDSLAIQAGRKFTTKDSDNNIDERKSNCAVDYTGAWWYRACHESNLNGKYGDDEFGKGINWYSWTGHRYSLKYTHMAIRPIRK